MVSVKLPEPVSRSTSVTGSPEPRWAQNSLMPPSKRNAACLTRSGSAWSPLGVPAGGSSRMLMVRPGTR